MWRFGLRILIYLILVVVVGYVIYLAFDLIAGETTPYDNKSIGQASHRSIVPVIKIPGYASNTNFTTLW